MKKAILFVLICILIVGCVPSAEMVDPLNENSEQVESASIPTLFKLMKPRRANASMPSYTKWENIPWELFEGIYNEGKRDAQNNEEEPRSLTIKQIGWNYTIENAEYREVKSCNMDDAYFTFYAWTVDRAFFRIYGETPEGYKIYCSDYADSMEILVLEMDDKEVLIAQKDSPIHNVSSYTVEDFGVCCFGSVYLGVTNEFPWLLDAHVNPKSGLTDSSKVFETYNQMHSYMTAMESTRYPGLTYMFIVSVLDGNEYVYCRSNEKMVSLEQKLNLEFEYTPNP